MLKLLFKRRQINFQIVAITGTLSTQEREHLRLRPVQSTLVPPRWTSCTRLHQTWRLGLPKPSLNQEAPNQILPRLQRISSRNSIKHCKWIFKGLRIGIHTNSSNLPFFGSELPYDPVCPSVGRSVGCLVCWSVCLPLSSKRAESFTSMLRLEHLLIIISQNLWTKTKYCNKF